VAHAGTAAQANDERLTSDPSLKRRLPVEHSPAC
jgi:hypothetical protein